VEFGKILKNINGKGFTPTSNVPGAGKFFSVYIFKDFPKFNLNSYELQKGGPDLIS
jgi:hypothetical protein